MSGDVRQIIESHCCFYGVSPYFTVSEDRLQEGAVSLRTVHARFDLDIYGVKMSCQPDPPAEFWLVYAKLKEVVDAVQHEYNHACSIAVIPFGSTVVVDTGSYLQPMTMLRIRITHKRAAHEPAGAVEQKALKSIEAQLGKLGITAGRSRE